MVSVVDQLLYSQHTDIILVNSILEDGALFRVADGDTTRYHLSNVPKRLLPYQAPSTTYARSASSLQTTQRRHITNARSMVAQSHHPGTSGHRQSVGPGNAMQVQAGETELANLRVAE